MGPGVNCSAHSECGYFDCKGRCDLVEGKCSGEIVNNNLQVSFNYSGHGVRTVEREINNLQLKFES